MALIGDVSTDFNVTGNYNLIISFDWAKFGNIGVSVATYKDADARNAGAKPLLVRTFYLANDPVDNNPTLTNLYDSIKLLPEFSSMSSDV